MGLNIFNFELDGRTVLGFDTGLHERAFAQAKVSSLITEPGYSVTPDGSVNIWKPEGVAELNKRMVIWGPGFEGTPLDIIIHRDTDKNAALNALRFWLRAIRILTEKDTFPAPSPRGVLISKNGAVLFPPAGLVKRTLDAEGPDAGLNASDRYLHPDLRGADALDFCAGAMLYQIFSGEPPFQNSNPDMLRSDIREGIFIPPGLTAPGLDEKTARLISNALKPEGARPGLPDFIEILGSAGSKQYDGFFRPVNDNERESLRLEREQYGKRTQARIKTKRFFHRNTAVFIGAGIGIGVIALTLWSIIGGLNRRPSTKGMPPYEVVSQYYASFGTLDHGFMEAAVINKAGKGDIDMIRNLYVISKVREAYERTVRVIPAQQWLNDGSRETEAMIFGITNLDLKEISQSADEVFFEARYILWLPANFAGEGETGSPPETKESQGWVPPVPIRYTDTLRLINQKNLWRIAEINRQQN